MADKPDTVVHYEALIASGESIYFDPVELDEIYHYYAENNEIGEVEKVLHLALQLHPDDPLVKQLDAEYTLNCGDSNEALEKLDVIFTPDHPFQCILRSAALAKLGRIAEAVEMAERALVDEDPNEYVAYDLGLGFMNAGQTTLALHYFERSASQHPDDIRTLSGILYCKARNFDTSDILELSERILQLDPFNYDAWIGKANALLAKELYAETIDACDYAIAIAPDEADPYIVKAKCATALDHQEEALSLMQEAADRAYDEQRASIYCLMSNMLDEMGKRDEAIKCCWKSIDVEDLNDKILMQAAYSFQFLDALSEACVLMKAAREKAPEDPSILQPLGDLLNRLEKYDEAAEVYEALFKVSPHAAVMALWGGTLLSLGKYGEALKKFKKANEMDEMWQTYVLMATCDIELKHFKKMEEHFRMAYAMCPDEALKLMETISPEIVKTMRENGFIDMLAKEREKWIQENEKRLRILAEERKDKETDILNLSDLLGTENNE